MIWGPPWAFGPFDLKDESVPVPLYSSMYLTHEFDFEI